MNETNTPKSNRWNISDPIALLALVISILTFSFSTEGKSLLCSVGISNSVCPKPPDCAIGSGDTCKCSDFKSWRQAQWVLETYSGDPHKLDGDKDGVACERLILQKRLQRNL